MTPVRILLAAAALTLALASPTSAEFFPIEQPARPPDAPCHDTGSPGAAQCVLQPVRVVPATRAQVKLIVAYKVRAVWGPYAAHHIRRYGCDLYRLPDEIGQTSTSCMTRFVSRRHRTVTRQLILSYGPAGAGVVGVTVRRFPQDGPGRTVAPTPPIGGEPISTTDPILTPDPTATPPITTDGPTITLAG
jgi:hypothetical protein